MYAKEYIELNGMCIEVEVETRKAVVYEVFDYDAAWEACDYVRSLPEDHGASLRECQLWADENWPEIEAECERNEEYRHEVAREEYMLGEW